jgi:hypothetical protein
MRYGAFVLSTLILSLPTLILSAGVAAAQTGFSTKTYLAVLPATSDNTKLLTADLNGDGRLDLLSYGSRSSSSTVPGNVFINKGSGVFLAPVALPGSGMLASAMIGDMNGDGFPDIVGCRNIGSGQTQAVSVIVYLNNGNGTFKALPAATGNGECNALMLGDVYHNGNLDVVTVGYTNGSYNPGGTFFPGDQNYIDVFSNDGTGSVTLKETGGGTLDDAGTSSTFTNCGAIDAVGGDFLQNGSFDLILTTNCQPLGQTLVGYAGTTFYAPESSNPSNGGAYDSFNHLQSANEIYSNGVATLDVDGEGQLDAVFLGSKNGTSGDLINAMNEGKESFTFNKLFSSTYFEGSAVADFNGDGLNDIATTYDPNINKGAPAGPSMLTILAGSGSGAFTNSQSFATGTATDLGGGVVAADFNGDGKPDLATLVYDTSAHTTSLNVYTNTQAGSSNACSAPTTPNTNIICSPAKGATLNSPVTVSAASNVTEFTLNRLYLDNESVYQTTSQQVSTPIDAATGDHTLVLVSYDSSGKAFTSSTSFTVGVATGSGCIPSSAGVSICSPTSGGTYESQITVTAGATAENGNITAMRVYIDNAAVYTISNPSASKTFEFSQALGVYSGSHHLVVVGYESTGGSVMNSLNFTVPSGPCTAPTQGTSLRICSPNETVTNSSPITVSAGAYTSTGYIAAMRIYIDNVAVALLNNPQKSPSFTINQSEPVSSGKHSLVVVAYPSTGGSASGQEIITVQ